MDRFEQIASGLSVNVETLKCEGETVTLSLDDLDRIVTDYVAMSNALCELNPELEGSATGEVRTVADFTGDVLAQLERGREALEMLREIRNADLIATEDVEIGDPTYGLLEEIDRLTDDDLGPSEL